MDGRVVTQGAGGRAVDYHVCVNCWNCENRASYQNWYFMNLFRLLVFFPYILCRIFPIWIEKTSDALVWQALLIDRQLIDKLTQKWKQNSSFRPKADKTELKDIGSEYRYEIMRGQHKGEEWKGVRFTLSRLKNNYCILLRQVRTKFHREVKWRSYTFSVDMLFFLNIANAL